MNIFEKKLEELLIDMPFEKLADGEKKYVLQHLTKEEYQRYHLLLKYSIVSFTNEFAITPDSIIKKNLKNTFRSTYKKPIVKFQFSNFQLPHFFGKPVLQVAFLLVFLIGIIGLFFDVDRHVKFTNIAKSEVGGRKIFDSKKFKKPQQTTKINAIVPSSSINIKLRVNVPKYKRSFEFHKTLPQISNIKNEELLCLKVKVEPVGLNLKIEEYTIPCLTTNILQIDSLINEFR